MNVTIDYRGDGFFESKKGRFLGFLIPDQFAALRKDPKNLLRRVATGTNQKLMNIKSEKVENNRLVVALRENNDYELFISAPLKRVKSMTSSNKGNDSVEFEDQDDAEIIITEISEESKE